VLAGVVAAIAIKAAIARFNTLEMSLIQRFRWLLLSRLSAHWLWWSGMPRQSFAGWFLLWCIEMSVYRKLNQARAKFHERGLKKTGYNSFSQYDYFELADFLVPALEIFHEIELSAIVSFGVELATMTITDLVDGSQIIITSPMSTAKLKACHEVQNLGAVQTYLRRYLWVTALEIVEHDGLDAGKAKIVKDTGEKPKNVVSGKDAMREDYNALPPDRKTVVDKVAQAIIDRFNADDLIGAYDEYTGLDEQSTERFSCWGMLPSQVRTALTKHKKSLQPTT
jgi:hypothetical protein